MSARRCYTIECDGPGCTAAVPTRNAFVDAARAVANSNGWWKVGESKQGSVDFCSPRCAIAYRMAAEADATVSGAPRG